MIYIIDSRTFVWSSMGIIWMNRPFPVYKNSNVAPRLGGMKQKKLIIHPSTSLLFLLFYSPNPRSQVSILIYRKWSIGETIKVIKLRKAIKNWQNRNEKKREKKQGRVWLSRTGCEWPPIHRCCPTTIWRGGFCLLCFHPGAVRSSLTNLENSDSPVFTILTPSLARTPNLHRTITPRNPALKPFNDPSLQVSGLQACANTPGWWSMNKINRWIVRNFDYLPEEKKPSMYCIHSAIYWD